MHNNNNNINLPGAIDNFSDDSRIWIYQSDRKLTESESRQIDGRLRIFCKDWTSHNHRLKCWAGVMFDRFILIVLDEMVSSNASGCSIDKQVSFIKGLSDEFGADFMNRDLFFFCLEEDHILPVLMSGLPQSIKDGFVDHQSPVFDNLIKTKKELTDQWLKPLKSSWHYRFA